mgnify:CR=1 FL=1
MCTYFDIFITTCVGYQLGIVQNSEIIAPKTYYEPTASSLQPSSGAYFSSAMLIARLPLAATLIHIR